MNQPNQNSSTFYGLGIAPKILDLLEQMKFKTPTPIQFKAIPVAIEGKDVIGVAQTGTGKTLAFGIPMIQRLASIQGRGLVLVPTRELALQVEEAINKVGSSFGMRTAVIIGGASMHIQIQALRRNPRVIIATPGRLIDHLGQSTLRIDDVKILVLDEADRMLDMGFAPQIDRIMRYLSPDRQTMLFSATIPEKIVRIAAAHMKLPVNVEVAPSGTAAERILQELFIIKKEEKAQLLGKLLDQYRGTVLLFSRTKEALRASPAACARWAIPRPRSIPTGRSRSGAKPSRALRPANTGSWWQPTSPPGASTSKGSNWSSIMTCPTTPKITCTGSAAPPGPGTKAMPFPLPLPTSAPKSAVSKN